MSTGNASAQNNVITAAEYQAAADEITAIINAQRAERVPLEAELDILRNRAQTQEQRRNTAFANLREAEINNDPTAIANASEAYRRANNDVFVTNQAQQQVRSSLEQSRQSTAQLQDQRNNLEINADLAQAGPPTLNSLTPPATVVPGQSATFVPTPPPPVLTEVSATPVATAPVITARTAAQPAASPAPVSSDGLPLGEFRDRNDELVRTQFNPEAQQRFTATATARTAEEAEALAIAQARAQAERELGGAGFGVAYSDFSEVRIKAISSPTGPNTGYTATYTTSASVALVPPTQPLETVTIAPPAGPPTPAPEPVTTDSGFVAEQPPTPAPTVTAPEPVFGTDLDNAQEQQIINGLDFPEPVVPNLFENPPLDGLDTEIILPPQRGPAPVDDPADNFVPDEPNPVFSPAVSQAQQAASVAAATTNAQRQSTLQSRKNQPSAADWRVRLQLAPGSDYLYNAKDAGLLAPLAGTDGVIFPYTPSIETNYKAKYQPYDLVHSNYRGYFYQSSSIDEISVKGTFTAQDTKEAQYLLAVIHFFRSVTKMFYGQDAQAGTPPPLVFLSGLGQYQFNNHPCLVSNFNYSLPTDVDYIRANGFNQMGLNLENRRNQSSGPAAGGGVPSLAGAALRLINNALTKGAVKAPPVPGAVAQTVTNQNSINSTYVPTKMEISITLLPIQTRNQVSQQFSLQGFAQGRLLQGGFW